MRVLFLHVCDEIRPFKTSIAALAGALRNQPYELCQHPIAIGTTVDDAASQVVARAPDVIAASFMSRDWPGFASLLPKIRERCGARIVVGGYHATFATESVASCDAVDAICIGEGERPFPRLLEAWKRGECPATAPGMWMRSHDGFVSPRPPSDPEPDIVNLPRWDYDLFGDGALRTSAREDPFMPVRASRGCPFDCSYCSNAAWMQVNQMRSGGFRNVRPVDHLCDELAELRDRYCPGGFEFWDEHFPIQPAWLAELQRVYPARVGIPFRVEMHPNTASDERLEALAGSGCVLVHFGVESGDPWLRRNVLLRRTTDEAYFRVFDKVRSLGMKVSASAMVVLPGETLEMGRRTLDLLRRLKPDHVSGAAYMPLPGTPLGESSRARSTRTTTERFIDTMWSGEPLVEPDAMTVEESRQLLREFKALHAEIRSSSGDTEHVTNQMLG